MESKTPDRRASRNIPKLNDVVFSVFIGQISSIKERFPKFWSHLNELPTHLV